MCDSCFTTPVRIRLDLSDFMDCNTKYHWMTLHAHKKYAFISDLVKDIALEYKIKDWENLIVYLDGPFVLDFWESVDVLRDGDVIKVTRKPIEWKGQRVPAFPMGGDKGQFRKLCPNLSKGPMRRQTIDTQPRLSKKSKNSPDKSEEHLNKANTSRDPSKKSGRKSKSKSPSGKSCNDRQASKPFFEAPGKRRPRPTGININRGRGRGQRRTGLIRSDKRPIGEGIPDRNRFKPFSPERNSRDLRRSDRFGGRKRGSRKSPRLSITKSRAGWRQSRRTRGQRSDKGRRSHRGAQNAFWPSRPNTIVTNTRAITRANLPSQSTFLGSTDEVTSVMVEMIPGHPFCKKTSYGTCSDLSRVTDSDNRQVTDNRQDTSTSTTISPDSWEFAKQWALTEMTKPSPLRNTGPCYKKGHLFKTTGRKYDVNDSLSDLSNTSASLRSIRSHTTKQNLSTDESKQTEVSECYIPPLRACPSSQTTKQSHCSTALFSSSLDQEKSVDAKTMDETGALSSKEKPKINRL